MKSKLTAAIIMCFLFAKVSIGQYKDLEGVFFGKVIALGTGGGISNFTDKSISSTHPYFTPLDYTVFFNNKKYSTVRVNIHQPFNVVTTLHDYANNTYTLTSKFKLYDIETNYRFSLTKEGMDKPFSVFFSFPLGLTIGKQSMTDSRYGDSGDGTISAITLGAGISLLQRLGSRFIVFAEPSYRYLINGSDIYVDDSYNKISLSHADVHFGVMFLIGKNQ